MPRLQVREYKQSLCLCCGKMCYFDLMNGEEMVLLEHFKGRLFYQHKCTGDRTHVRYVVKAAIVGVYNKFKYGEEVWDGK